MVDLGVSVIERVTDILSQYPKARDSDNVLLAFIWRQDVGEEFDRMTARQLMKKVWDGDLTSPETVRRVRQKVQQENPALRGTVYGQRHERAETVKSQLSNNFSKP